MSEFKKKEIHFHQDQYNSILNVYNKRLPFYQEILNEYNRLGIQSTLQKEDLKELIQNTKAFLANKIMDGQEMTVGSLKISASAFFDMIEKPENYIAFISYVEKNTNSIEAKERYVWQVDNYCIDGNGKNILLRPEVVETLRESSTVYIKSEKQQEAFDLLTDIALKLNSLKDLKPNFTGSDSLNSCLNFSGNLNDPNNKITVNPVCINNF